MTHDTNARGMEARRGETAGLDGEAATARSAQADAPKAEGEAAGSTSRASDSADAGMVRHLIFAAIQHDNDVKPLRVAEAAADRVFDMLVRGGHLAGSTSRAAAPAFQGGLTNDELREAWRQKLPAVEPTDRDLTAFALGVEVGASRAAAPAPDTRSCTCHPDDNPPTPCPRKFAISECRTAAPEAPAEHVGWFKPAEGRRGSALHRRKPGYDDAYRADGWEPVYRLAAAPAAAQGDKPQSLGVPASPSGSTLQPAVSAAIPNADLRTAIATAPERIWLQISDDESHLDEPFDVGAEITWCQDSVLQAEVEYVRADLAASPAPIAGESGILVPAEPTPEMLRAGRQKSLLSEVYKAMVAAARGMEARQGLDAEGTTARSPTGDAPNNRGAAASGSAEEVNLAGTAGAAPLTDPLGRTT